MWWTRIATKGIPRAALRDGGAPLLRGVFGARLRELSCDAPPDLGGGCPHDPACAYGRLFEAPGPGPAPYRITALPEAAGWRFTLLLLGCVGDRHGEVAHRAFWASLLDLATVEPLCVSHHSEPFDCGNGEEPRVHMELRSPLRIKRGGRLLREPEALDFPLLADSLVERLHAIDLTFGTGKGIAARRALRAGARAARTARREIRFVDRWRYSQRQRRAVPVGGWLGHVEWDGVPGALLPLLRAGAELGVGSGCSYGLGAYELEVTASTHSGVRRST